MSNYFKVPLEMVQSESGIALMPTLDRTVAMLDNLIELAVFTPKGSFTADPDFGFEYWNYEYANVDIRSFNDGQKSPNTDASKQVCEESIRESILTYSTMLKKVMVTMELKLLTHQEQRRRKSTSRYEVIVNVTGEIDDGLGTMRPYSKDVRFLMEPVAKTISF